MAAKLLLILSAAFASTCAGHVTVPLNLNPGDDDVVERTVHTVAQTKRVTDGLKLTFEPATFAGNKFWYGPFNVGSSKNLNLAIDTGSTIVEINPGLYKPSPQAINLHETNTTGYYGTQPDGCGSLLLKFNKFQDTVTAQDLTAKDQYVADTIPIKKLPPGAISQLPPPFQGIVGLAGTGDYEYQGLGGPPFFDNLCKQGQVDECRFGVAFGTSGNGSLVLGGIDNALFEGGLKRTPLSQDGEWLINGAYASNGSILGDKQLFIFDTGTPNVIGPKNYVSELFKIHGIQAVERKIPGCGTALFGYYPCDNPPEIGFTVGHTIFNIEPSSFALRKNGKNNCTATLVGGTPIEKGEENLWLIGQAWMQGKYLDHDVKGKSFAAAQLKDPVGAT